MTNKRAVKKGDLLVVTKLNGKMLEEPKVVTVLKIEEDFDLIRVVPEMTEGEDLLEIDCEESDVWYFADEYEEQTKKEYNDEAMMPSYSAVATSLEDYTGVGITADSLAFVSSTDKALDTITPSSLAFEEAQKDAVNHPSHYTTGQTEVIDILEDLASRYDNPVDAYLVATAAKYLFRSPFKGAQEQDIRKAVWYLSRLADNIAKRNEL